MLVQCYYCKNKVDKADTVRHNDKNFHAHCLQEYLEKKDLVDYICKMCGFKANLPGPKIHSQLKTFQQKYKYTFPEMKMALQYFYEVQGGKVSDKNKDSVGIIPFVMEEATSYYDALKKKQEAIKKNLTDNTDNMITIKMPKKDTSSKKKTNQLYSLDKMLEE